MIDVSAFFWLVRAIQLLVADVQRAKTTPTKEMGSQHKYDLYRRRSTFTFEQNVRVFRDRQNKQIANGRFGAREHNYCYDIFSSTHRK